MIHKFPNEIIEKIIGPLDFESKMNVVKVCRHWSHFGKPYGICILYFDQFDGRDDDDDDEKKRPKQKKICIDNKGPNFFRLVKSYDPPNVRVAADGNDDKRMAYIKEEIPTEAEGATMHHILVFSYRPLSNKVFSFLQQRCPKVVRFDYNYDWLDAGADTVLLVNGNRLPLWSRHQHFLSSTWFHTIEHLPSCHITNIAWFFHTPALSNRLKSLYLQDGDLLLKDNNFPDKGYCLTQFPYLRSLTSLTLHVPIKLDTERLNFIHEICPNLTALTFRDMSLISLDTLNPIVRLHLEELSFINVTFLNESVLQFLPRKFPTVRKLTLSTTNRPSSASSSYHSQQHDPLAITTLHLESLFSMINAFPRLNKLELHLSGGNSATHKDDLKIQAFQKKWQQRFLFPRRNACSFNFA